MVQIISFVSQEEFNNHVASSQRDHVLVTHFWASWATQCQHMDQVLEELAKSVDQQKISFCKVNVENDEALCKKYHILSVPTFVFFKNGQVVDRLEGADAPCLTAKVRSFANKISLEVPPEQSSVAQDLNERIKKLIDSAPCLLFMKGSADKPRCGFSKQALEILNKHNADFMTCDILLDSELREGLKEYSDWPTYPQLYVNSKLIGGLDIMRELDEAGTLAPKLPKKETALIEDRLQALINQAPVMVFMKGSPEEPRCGFSKTLVSIFNNTGVEYATFDILKDEEVRQGLKTFSDWPTYPQVYVMGSLIGGLDIIKELQESGQLLKKLQKK